MQLLHPGSPNELHLPARATQVSPDSLNNDTHNAVRLYTPLLHSLPTVKIKRSHLKITKIEGALETGQNKSGLEI